MQTLADLPSTAIAMATLTASHPALAAAIAAMPASEGERTASIATDDERIHINPDFIAERDDAGRVYMLAFIAEMVAARCLERAGDRDRLAWQTACNMAIHQRLATLGVPGRPDDVSPMHDDAASGMTDEAIHDAIVAGDIRIGGRTLAEIRALQVDFDAFMDDEGKLVLEDVRDAG